MRLFIAVNFSRQTRAALSSLLRQLRSHAQRGNFSRPEHLHLTLVFLGECDPRRTSIVKQALHAVIAEPFSITMAGGGYWDKGRPNLVFCGLRNDGGYDRLRRLQSDLQSNLSSKGLALDPRKFWPHITLGRKVVWRDTGDFSHFIEVPFPAIEERVTRIALMKSERIGGKLIYTPILEKELSLGGD